MNEKNQTKHEHRSWLERLSDLLLREPQDREQLVNLLREAEQRQLLDANALTMMEGVLQVSSMQVREIMVPRSQIIGINEKSSLEEFLPRAIESGHSRFPVFNEQDEIIGILLAKDLLREVYETKLKQHTFNIHEILRPVIFVPESKRLNILLQDFRIKRNHMAIVVDEYGGIAGLVTIEDVLEQIVGEIDDEYDIDEEPCIKKSSQSHYIVKALTPIDEFNEYFGTMLEKEEYDTIGGLVMKNFGHIPQPGEIITIDGFEFKVLHADKRRVRVLQATVLEKCE